MKASRLFECLQKALDSHGDLDVSIVGLANEEEEAPLSGVSLLCNESDVVERILLCDAEAMNSFSDLAKDVEELGASAK